MSSAVGLEIAEFVGMVVADHRRMLAGRPQVLTDGQNAAADLEEIREGGDKLVVLLAEADHQSRLGRDGGRVRASASSSCSVRS